MVNLGSLRTRLCHLYFYVILKHLKTNKFRLLLLVSSVASIKDDHDS